MKQHEPCASRGDCYHARAARNQPREVKVRGGRVGGPLGGRIGDREGKARGGRNGSHEDKARAGRMGGRNGSHEDKARAGRMGSHEDKARAGRIGGSIGGHNGNREGKARAGRINGLKVLKSGQLARISKGVPSTADGILFRSQTEASFYCVTKELGGNPVYEPETIKLDDGTSYTPDFVLGNFVLGIPAYVPIELKPARNAYYNGNLGKAVKAGATVVYWDELVET